jgi:zinc transporter ZupT
LLVFAGAYIFSITIVHLMPELFLATKQPRIIALFILVGFFMQIFLDFLTTGVEHGHLHKHQHHGHSVSPIMLMVGLIIHAFMDGSILVHPGENTGNDGGFHALSLLVGIILHKIPAAVVLMSVLQMKFSSKKILIALLLIFSIASPIGLILSDFLNESQILSRETFLIVFAIVSGNFLHISTTIYFETSPDHQYNRKKIVISLIAALLAISIEFLHH